MLTPERVEEMIEEVEAMRTELDADSERGFERLDEATHACDNLVTTLMNLSNEV